MSFADDLPAPTEKRASSTEQTLLGIPEQCFKAVDRSTNGATGCSLHLRLEMITIWKKKETAY